MLLFVVWMLLGILHFRYVTPLIEALMAYCVECMRVQVHQSCGLQRDPKHLKEAAENLQNAAGRFAPLLDQLEVMNMDWVVTGPVALGEVAAGAGGIIEKE